MGVFGHRTATPANTHAVLNGLAETLVVVRPNRSTEVRVQSLARVSCAKCSERPNDRDNRGRRVDVEFKTDGAEPSG